ncbi:mitochondrial ribosome-associated GTPase 2 [Cylas formicarius]|uniref:mitochondrial ribosome-associated GTPase 2 n=1 Tax=Cylas formicarius TaxID=197179 RepID=UPI002958876F|nr:mitochondrial ribosome-associated GTPase 2 [Cylas formicarius]
MFFLIRFKGCLTNYRLQINTTQRIAQFCQRIGQPVRSKKPTSAGNAVQNFADLKHVRVVGGSGGNGCISFLQLWCNENAGPDGGDGGNGGHVIFEASSHVRDLNQMPTVIAGDSGVKGTNKDCNGKNAQHKVVKVPVGTVVKNAEGKVVCDLCKEGLMFIAARGGAGGKGNSFFVTDVEQAPKICEYGAEGENLQYTVEVKSIAHVGLIGLPNAGKSTLLRAISRARPKVAPYPFTTLKPHLGMVQYDDYEQIAVADLPGLVRDSHKNRGLGIQFLKHTERCAALLYVIDVSLPEPWRHLEILRFELAQFNESFARKPQVVVANKMDLADAEENLPELRSRIDLPVVPISAKFGTNVRKLLEKMRAIYDDNVGQSVE